jgi:ribosomal protein S18 acetylase RimI-like enzyme
MMMYKVDYIIRYARKADIGAIVRLCEEHAAYEGADYSPEGTAEQLALHLFSSKKTLQCIVVEHEKNLVGYATCMLEFSTWDASFYMHMDCLYLQEGYRGKGIGKQLLRQVAKEAHRQGCTLVQWQTPESNANAIDFYHRMGATSKHKLRMYLSGNSLHQLIKKKNQTQR